MRAIAFNGRQLRRSVLPLLLCLLSLSAFSQWVRQGPGPSINGQTENITQNPTTGAVNCVVPHPSLAATLYVGGANGGVWRTVDATAASPNWTYISGDLPSQAIGALAFDPTDASNQTLVTGIGRTSSFGSLGGGGRGVFRTTNGVGPWTDIDPAGTLGNLNVTGIAARGATIVAATSNGVWRTTNTGTNWNIVSGAGGTGLPAGVSFDLVGDPSDQTVLYCNGGANGIYRSSDQGANWTRVSSPAMNTLIATANNVEITVGQNNNVFVAVVTGGQLSGLFRSGNGGTTWTAMDLPTTFEGCLNVGIHPGGQGARHLSMVADPADDNVVYIGGDRQASPRFDGGCVPPSPTGFPNSIGAANWTGRLFRVDASLASGSQSAPITHSGTASNSAPHADSREMAFDANGDLLEGDDGGIYRQSDPATAGGDWASVIGNLNVTEAHSMDRDGNANIILNGLQDNGVPQQVNPTDGEWNTLSRGDGGDVAIDDISSTTLSTRFFSNQRFGNFQRQTFNAGNAFQAGSRVFPTLLNTASGNPITNDPTLAVNFPFVTPLKLNSQNGNRLLIGTNAGIFESADQGATVTLISANVANNFGRDPLVYGHTANANLILAGSGSQILLRTAAAGAPAAVGGYTGGNIEALAIDPNDAQSFYALDNNQVFETTNQGANFTDRTGNLIALNPGTLRSIAYIPNSTNDQLAVGADNGVYIAAGPDFDAWVQLGTDLPNVIVLDLEYDVADETLTAATMGRGNWTFNLTERDPIDVALVMDFSGSMLSPACTGCNPKIDVLKDAAEIFIQLWKGLAVGDDRLSGVYFRTDVNSFSAGGSNLFPVLANADNLISDIRGQSTTLNELTAMGGGLQQAINQFDAAPTPKNIILFTDGMQNVNPGVTDPALEIRDGQYSANSNVSQSSPVTVLNTAGGITVNTIGVGAGPAFSTPLASIASATDGVTKVTTAPDDDLIQFYVEDLVDVLRNSSPQLIAYRKGVYSGGVTETVLVNSSSKKLVFKVSYPRGTNHDIRILKNGKEVTQFAEVTNGDFYRIYSYSFEMLRQIENTIPGYEWAVNISGGNQDVKYQVAVISDEQRLNYNFFTGQTLVNVGDELTFRAVVDLDGKPIPRFVKIAAKIFAPRSSLAELYAKLDPRLADEFKFEPGTPLGTRLWRVASRDERYAKDLTPVEKVLQLDANRRGVFSGAFGDTKIPGVYTVTFELTGAHPETGPFQRIETRTFIVEPGPINLEASNPRIRKLGNGRWSWEIRPVDKSGNLYGSDYLPMLQIKTEGGRVVERRAEGKGAYRIIFEGDRPEVNISLRGKNWFKGLLKE